MGRVRQPKVAGVELDRVRAPLVDGALSAAGLSLEGGLPLRVLRLFHHVRGTVPESCRAPCAACGGSGDVRLSSCVYCGDGFGEPEHEAVGRAIERVPPAALVRVDAGPSAAELDRALAGVRRATAGAVGSLWDLGRALWAIYEPRLYLARHADWESFLFAEVGIAPETTYRLMAVARSFDRETVEELGPARLVLVLRVPEERRAALLEQARRGLGAAGLAKQAERMGLVVRRSRGPGPCAERGYLRVPLGAHSAELPVVVGDFCSKFSNARPHPVAEGVLALPGGEIRVRVTRQRDGNLRVALGVRASGRR